MSDFWKDGVYVGQCVGKKSKVSFSGGRVRSGRKQDYDDFRGDDLGGFPAAA